MFGALFALLGGWRGVLNLGMITALVSILASYVYSYDARGREIVSLTDKVSVLTHSVVVEKTNVELRDTTISTLNDHLKASLVSIDKACVMIKAIDAANDPGADKPVGPPLSTTLGSIRKQGD